MGGGLGGWFSLIIFLKRSPGGSSVTIGLIRWFDGKASDGAAENRRNHPKDWPGTVFWRCWKNIEKYACTNCFLNFH